MPFDLQDRIYETSVTTGTGTYTLAGAVTGFQAFSVITANNYTTYFATDDTNWEIGIGQVLTGPARLTRDAILASSNSGSAVNWGSGTRKIRCGAPAAYGRPRYKSKSVAGSSNVTLTQEEQRCDILVLTGVLTGNIDVIVDATPWSWPTVYNNTSGAFTLTLKVSGQTGVTITQGTRVALINDGTDVRSVSASAASGGTTAPRVLENLGLSVSMAANAVTIALKGADGNDPSSSNAVGIGFRSSTLTSGASNKRSVTAALSTVISSGSTGGTVSATASRIWIAAIDNAGTVELAWFNARSGTSIAPINEGGVISTTAEGGAGAADSAQTWYSTTARSNVPVTVLGYFDSTQTTAGTWAASPTTVVVNPRFRPGDTIQQARNTTASVVTCSTAIPADDTIPQNTEGNQVLSQAITPTAAANLLQIQFNAHYEASAASGRGFSALFQDSTANALASFNGVSHGAPAGQFDWIWQMLAGTTSSTTLAVRVGGNAATCYINGDTAGARLLGGSANAQLLIQEVVA